MMLGARTVLLVLVLASCLCGAFCQRGTSEKSYVLPVYHQAYGNQPYPRSAQSQAMSITLGSSAGNKVPYKFTVDTGSGVLLATCRSPQSLANCNNDLPANKNYEISSATTVGDAATCTSTGIGCLLSPSEGGSNKCFLSEQLTGGGGNYNVYNAIVAQDTISFGQVTSLTTYRFYSKGHSSSSVNKKETALSFKGLFGCAEAYKQCTSDSPADCLTVSSTCPVGPPPSSLFEGKCPDSNKGIEAGWTFNAGGPAPAMAVPEQAFKAGLISKKVTGFCYQRPQKDFNCRARMKSNSAVVLGAALPKALPSASHLYKAPLIPAVFPKDVQPGQAIPQTHTFRSSVSSVTVPVYDTNTPWTEALQNVSVLWDTGAYGQSTVPTPAYDAFVRYFDAAWAAVNASAAMKHYEFVVESCPDVQEVCGLNIDKAAKHSCLQIKLPEDSSPSTHVAARRVLESLYPRAIKIKLAGGAVARLPTAFTLNMCGGEDTTDNLGVAVCSYIQSPGSTSSSYFWLAGPWFVGRYVQFDASSKMSGFPDSTGTVSWSDPISCCNF